jgi:hypothetical protein
MLRTQLSGPVSLLAGDFQKPARDFESPAHPERRPPGLAASGHPPRAVAKSAPALALFSDGSRCANQPKETPPNLVEIAPWYRRVTPQHYTTG